jgi:hypothetical protein
MQPSFIRSGMVDARVTEKTKGTIEEKYSSLR